MRFNVRQYAATFLHFIGLCPRTLLLCCAFSLLIPMLLPRSAHADSRVSLFIPIAANVSSGCSLSGDELLIEEQMVGTPEQNRITFTCNATLTQVARERALDMATRDYVSHVNPDGYGPNYLVRQAGYPLPDYYSSDPASNNIESIAAGYNNAVTVWSSWMDSDSHRTHLLGETEFYAEQIDYGIGHVYVESGSTYQHYWVVLTAKPGP